jgi:hypothetical protein
MRRLPVQPGTRDRRVHLAESKEIAIALLPPRSSGPRTRTSPMGLELTIPVTYGFLSAPV